MEIDDHQLTWREVGHSEAMTFALGRAGTPRVEWEPGDTPYAWAHVLCFADGTALRIAHTSMDSSVPATYYIGKPKTESGLPRG